jgi:hypothetical protein
MLARFENRKDIIKIAALWWSSRPLLFCRQGGGYLLHLKTLGMFYMRTRVGTGCKADFAREMPAGLPPQQNYRLNEFMYIKSSQRHATVNCCDTIWIFHMPLHTSLSRATDRRPKNSFIRRFPPPRFIEGATAQGLRGLKYVSTAKSTRKMYYTFFVSFLAGLAIAPTFEYTLGLRDAYDSHSYSIDFVVGVMSQGYIILYLHLFTFTGLCGSFAHYVFNLVIFLIVDVELFSNGGASASIQVIQQIGVCTWRMRPAKPLQFPEITPQMGP